nr:phage portal protein [Notoacmeibacter sp. MSK16QG-6]
MRSKSERPAADAGYALTDPYLAELLRGESATASGVTVTIDQALKNTTVMRCVSLTSFAIGRLPLHLIDAETKEKAKDHPLFRLLHRQPNPWQTAFEFRSLLQQRALQHGDAYARIVRNPGKSVIALVPLPTREVTPRQKSDWSLEYVWQPPKGEKKVFSAREVFHLRYGISEDGIRGISVVRQAAEAIGLALQAERAAARIFAEGMLAGGKLKHPNALSPEARERLRASMEAYAGAGAAGKWLVMEEGMDAEPFGSDAQGNQHLETRQHQIEEIARPFGVPRPLLGVDDTSWGSGIDVLGQFFVRYGLDPWFEAWQQAIARDLFTDREQDELEAKFNAGALLRGSMKDQADFFAKGLGAGGHQPFLHQNEVRDWLDMPAREDLPERATAAKMTEEKQS